MFRLFSLFLISVFALQAASAQNYLKAFPPAKKGMERFVLQLPAKENEADYRVELIAGKTVKTDPINHYFYSGVIRPETVKGWGFTRYVIDDLGALAGSMMAVRPGTPKVERFITLGKRPYLIRYNSKIPVVVYAPKGVELRYRIWSAQKESHPIPRLP